MSIKFRKTRAFTLIEVLLTLTIFAVVAMISVNLLVNGLRSAKRIQAQVYLYSEAQALMDQIARDVQSNTVDYEAYYSRNVLEDVSWDTPTYGYYGQSFFDPGTGGNAPGPYVDVNDWYGATCPSDTSLLYPDSCPGETPVYSQLDFDTGAHPFDGIADDYPSDYNTDDPTYMNAFCQGTAASPDHGSSTCADAGVPFTNELILVNGAGDTRIIFVKEPFDDSPTEYGLSRLVMSGTDTNNDGIEDHWECASGYSCSDPAVLADFMPLSPLNISIVSFDILISPSEDPYRGFAEEAAQLQPQVTIIMEVSLSSEFGSGLLGEVPSILIQRTISTGVYSKVSSYE